ncbi:MAG: hypothetical protein WDW36_003107 [Sanguina aurantia]
MSHKRPAVQQAAPAVSHRLLLADELGMWKACEVTEGQWSTPAIVQRWGVPNKALAVHAMAVGLTTGGSYGVPLVALARPGGTIDMYDSLEGTAQGSIGGASTSGEQQGGLLSQALLSCTASGLVRIHKQIRISVPAVSPPEGQSEEEKDPLHRCPSLCPSQAVDSSNRYLAVGGEGYNLQVWDIQTRLEVFHAKGGKPSRCGLTDLAHITALAFLPTPAPTSPEEPLTDARRVLVGTAKHKLWLYDTAAGKRPQLEVSWGECRITSVVAELDGSRAWASNGAGDIASLDFKKREMMGALHGPGGSVRSLALHPTEPLLLVAGLDRYLRVYNTTTRKQLLKVYCKQQLASAAFSAVPVPEVVVAPTEEEQAAASGGREAGESSEEDEEPRARGGRGRGSSDGSRGGGRSSSGRGYTPSPRGGRGGRGASQAPVKRQRSSRDD